MRCIPLILISLLQLSACDYFKKPAAAPAAAHSSAPAGDIRRMTLSVPGPLVEESTKNKKPLNLEDPESVAYALGIKLNGDSKQVLYVIGLTAPTENGMAKREIPIRVDNIKDGANMIREWQSPF